jgi:hypothetical protein
MMVTRISLGVLGIAAMVFGALLTVDLPDKAEIAAWFLAGPIGHDVVVAPVVGGFGLLLARVLGPPWRAPVIVATGFSALLVALAVPLLWQDHVPAVNPGLHDRNYPLGLGIAIGTSWLIALTIGLLRTMRDRRRPRTPAASRPEQAPA